MSSLRYEDEQNKDNFVVSKEDFLYLLECNMFGLRRSSLHVPRTSVSDASQVVGVNVTCISGIVKISSE